ncbi:uncharacterized protein [Diadema setosum]|uniref:uncharacterized protein n=1 Tax=Diadema setosum TaxID=31175 RepID=UPI003B3B9E4E
MLHKRANPTERIYQKVVEPSLGSFRAVPHASHSYVRHQPALPAPTAPSLILTSALDRPASVPPETRLPKIQVGTRMTRSAMDLGIGQIMYQPNKDDASNQHRTAATNSFSSTTRLKQVPLPQVKSQEFGRTATPRGMKNVSISGDRYLGTVKAQPIQNSPVTHQSYPQYKVSSLPKTEQVRRFEDEQSNLHISRTLKRKSEILSHRVDRMYYLCGSNLPARGKYQVDEAELEKLREYSRMRNANRVNSGRSSVRSGRSHAVSSYLSEFDEPGVIAPCGSERYTPLSRDGSVNLSVQGSSVPPKSDEASDRIASDETSQKNQDGGAEDRLAAQESGDQGESENQTKDEQGSETHKEEDSVHSGTEQSTSASNAKTSPHRTDGGEGDGRTGDEDGRKEDGHQPTGASEEATSKDSNGSGSGDGAHDRGEGSGVESESNSARKENESGSSEGNADAEQDAQGTVDASHPGNGDEDGGVDGGHGDQVTSNDDAGVDKSAAGDDESRGAGDTVENGSESITAGDGGSNVENGGEDSKDSDGVATNREENEEADCEGKDGEASLDGKEEEEKGENSTSGDDPQDEHLESIAPGLKLDKTPVTLKKSDVYLTDFTNPNRRDSDVELGDLHHHASGSHDDEIASMEQNLQRVDALTQNVDDVGHLSESSYDPSDFDPEEDPNGRSFDAGVFAKVKSEEERRRAEQLKRERREAKSAAKAAAQEEMEERKKAESAWAKKRTPRVKFKIAEIYNFISSRQREIFTHKFQELDSNKDGKITVKELTRKMHKGASKEDAQQLIKVFDLNKDKTIDQREFVTVAALNDKLNGTEIESENDPLELNLQKLSLHITAYKEMFETVDQNQNGRLSMEEIMLIVSLSVGTEVGTDTDVVQYIHNTIDKDDDGTIDFVEFLSYIPFFLKIHKDIVGKPVTVKEIEEARLAVREAMLRR